MTAHPPSFVDPQLHAPMTRAVALASVPVDATIKGMFLTEILEQCERRGAPLIGMGPYTAFRDYPGTLFVDVVFAAHQAAFPTMTVRAAAAELGRGGYDALRQSMVGRVVFGVLGPNVTSIIKMAPKGYSLAGKGVRGEVVGVGSDWAHLRLHGALMADCYQVGVYDGVLALCGLVGQTRIKREGDLVVELFTVWRPLSQTT